MRTEDDNPSRRFAHLDEQRVISNKKAIFCARVPISHQERKCASNLRLTDQREARGTARRANRDAAFPVQEVGRTVLASGSRQVCELLESDTARGVKTNGRRRAAAVETDVPRPRRTWPGCARRRWTEESPEVDGDGAAPWWRAGIMVMDDGEAMAAIAIAPAVRKDWGGRRRAAELTGSL